MTSPLTTADAFYIVIAAIVAFILGLAAVITALTVIYSKGVKPLRDHVNTKLFAPLATAVAGVTTISDTLTGFGSRLDEIENKLKFTDLSLLTEQIKDLTKQVFIHRFSLKYFFERDPRPMFVLDEKGECVFANNALCELLDVDSSELEYRNWLQKIHHAERIEVTRILSECYKDKMPFDHEQTFLIGSSTIRPKKLRMCAKPIVFEDKVVRFIGNIESCENFAS